MNFSRRVCPSREEYLKEKSIFKMEMVIAHSRAELYFRDDIITFDDLFLLSAKNRVYEFIYVRLSVIAAQ